MGLPHGEMDSGPGYTIVLGPCYACQQIFEFNPYTVISVPVDPQTSLPPDVAPGGGRITPDPAAVARSVNQQLCNGCATRAGVDTALLPEQSSQ